MKPAEKKRYEAHVRFELERMENAVENGFLKQELQLLWATVGKLTLAKLLPQQALTDTVQRQVTEGPVTNAMLQLISEVAQELVAAEANKTTVLADLIAEKDRKALQKQALTLEKLRRDLITATVNNPLYTDTVADLLYHGIRDYVAAGSEFTKKVPGMGSLMSRGGDFIGKRMEGLEEKIEEKVRGYITGNMHKILERSEAMLQSSLTPQQLGKIGDELWVELQKLSPRVDGYISQKDIQGFAKTGASLWQHFRATDYFKAQLETAIAAVYHHAGRKQLANWLADLGIDEAFVLNELMQQWPLLYPALESSGYLEKVTRARLEPFYAQF